MYIVYCTHSLWDQSYDNGSPENHNIVNTGYWLLRAY